MPNPDDIAPNPDDIALACRQDLLRVEERLAALDDDPAAVDGAQQVALKVGRALAALYVEFPAAAFETLLHQKGWAHPTQALPRPRPGLRQLLELCERRLAEPGPPSRRLQSTHRKLVRAVRIAESARARRELAAILAERQEHKGPQRY